MPRGEEKSAVHDIVVIGCSAGGVEALPKLLSKLPEDTPAALFVVMHVGATSVSFLPQIIGRATSLPVDHVRDGEKIEPGRIYVAPPDNHIVLDDKKVHLNHGPKENRHRPAVDPLFRSAAEHHGSRVIGIILTGALDDGAAGLHAVKRCGGLTLVQHPEDASAPGMPTSALQVVEVDHCVPLLRMRTLLPQLIKSPPGQPAKAGCHEEAKTFNLNHTMTLKEMEQKYGHPSGMICPECNGPIWETAEGKVTQFRCLVGHAYSPESFVAEEGVAVERSLWVAVKTLQERASLLRRLSDKSQSMGQSITSANFREQAKESEDHAEVIRNIVKKFSGNGDS
jgi:two-component system, chemotaxis family, protein-glutamate methylesterase/glutaminase